MRLTAIIECIALAVLTSCAQETIIVGDTGSDASLPDMMVDTTADMVGEDEDGGDVTWYPPIDNLGAPGWRESTDPVCSDGDRERLRGTGVWSDHRGVFFSVEHETWSPPHGAEKSIWFNDGGGWEVLLDMLYEYMEGPMVEMESIRGVPGGDLIMWGQYSFMTIDAESAEIAIEWTGLSHAHVVNENLAYAIPIGDPRLIQFDGTSWGPRPGDPAPYDVYRIWADDTTIFCAGDNGIVISSEEDRWTVHDTATLVWLQAIWGFSGTDVWVGGEAGTLIHYDGTDWTRIEWPDAADGLDRCREPGADIRGMWGSDGVLFFYTYNQLVKWDGEEFTVLGYWGGFDAEHPDGGRYCARSLWIMDVWGSSPDEVFIVVGDGEGIDGPCERYLLWWDGSEFHWM